MAQLVTIFGGSGFLGRYIARRMAAEGWRDMGMIAEQLQEWSYAERWYNESGASLPDRGSGYVRKGKFRNFVRISG